MTVHIGPNHIAGLAGGADGALNFHKKKFEGQRLINDDHIGRAGEVSAVIERGGRPFSNRTNVWEIIFG